MCTASVQIDSKTCFELLNSLNKMQLGSRRGGQGLGRPHERGGGGHHQAQGEGGAGQTKMQNFQLQRTFSF